MSKYDDAVELLEHYANNGDRIANEARLILNLLALVRGCNVKQIRDAVLPEIKDRVSNLEWNVDGNLEVGTDSSDGVVQLVSALEDAIKAITGRKMQWHPHSFE